MKKNILNIGLLAMVGFAGIVASCSNDFDFDEARRENPEFAYKENFEKAFGKIDPNQSWDFTTGNYSYTRATGLDQDNTPTVTKSDDYYYIEQSTLTWMQDILKESQNNTSLGNSFMMTMPNNSFTMIPIYQGQAGMSWELHLVVGTGDDATDTMIWQKSEGIQVGGLCSYCNGTGHDPNCTECGGTGKEKCENCDGTGTVAGAPMGTWTGLYQISTGNGNSKRNLNGTTVSTDATSSKQYAVVNVDSKNYLCYLDGNSLKYIKVNRSGWLTTYTYSISSVNSVNDATPLKSSPATNGYLSFAYNSSTTVYWNNGTVRTSTTNRTSWSWSSSTASESVSAIITAALATQVTCEECEGTGHTDHDCNGQECSHCGGTGAGSSWTNLSSSGNTLKAQAVRATKITIDDLPAGVPMYFYLQVTRGSSNYATTGTKQSSLGGQMLALDCPIPSNLGKADNGEERETMIIGMEDANLRNSDWDYNDIVFLVYGNPVKPKDVVITDDGITQYQAKRYMLEDLGATSESDIDFNDLVIDFSRSRQVTWSLKNGVIDPDTYHEGPWSAVTATVRALGGTKNLSVFLSSTAEDATQDQSSDPCIFTKDMQYGGGYYSPIKTVNYNASYGSGLNIASGLTASVMYNTVGQSDKSRFEKNSDQYYSVTDYIATVTIGADDVDEDHMWDYDANNIYVMVYDDKSDFVSPNTGANGTTIISFPPAGTIPAMIAVSARTVELPGQDWNWERVNVFKNTEAGCLLQLVNGTGKDELNNYPTKP